MNNLFLFTGENHQALSEKLRFWEQEFIKKHSDANLEKFESISQKDIPHLISVIETQPFLADKRMVIIKDLPQAADVKKKLETDALETLLTDIPDSSLVIFVSAKPDKRLRFYKELVKHAQVERFELPKGRELLSWIQQRLQAVGKGIEPDALDLLVLYCAGDIDRIAGELEKLQLVGRDTIRKEDIERFVSPTPEAKIFQSLDLIGKAPQQHILQSFDRLISSGEEIMMVFYMIVRQFRLLVQLRSLLDSNTPRPVIQKRMKLAPFQVGMLSKQASSFRFDQLSSAYRKLAQLDYQIKTGRIPITAGNTELLHFKIDQFLCSLYEQ